MATYFWVGGAGTWSTTGNTQFATSSGGTATASNPGTADTVIFDSLSNVAGGGASYTVTRTATNGITSLTVGNPSAGTVTLTVSGVITISGTLTVTSGIIAGTAVITVSGTSVSVSAGVTWSHSGTLTFTTANIKTVSTNGVVMASPITVNISTGTITFSTTLVTSGLFTFSAGTIAVGSYIKCNTFSQTAGTCVANNTFEITGNNTTVLTLTGLAFTGSTSLQFLYTYAGGTGTRTINCTRAYGTHIFGPATGSATDIINVTASNTFGALQFNSTFNGTFSGSSAFNIDTSNLTSSPGLSVSTSSIMTWTQSGAISFLGTTSVSSGNFQSSFVLPNPVTINSIGTVTFTGIVMSNFLTLIKGSYVNGTGTILGGFVSSGVTARSIDTGSAGVPIQIKTTTSGLIWNTTGAQTGLTFLTTFLNVIFDCPSATSGTTFTIDSGTGATTSGYMKFNMKNGSYGLTITSANVLNSLDFTDTVLNNGTGFGGTIANTSFTVYGNIYLSSNMTWTIGANTVTVNNNSVSASSVIKCNTNSFGCYLTFTGSTSITNISDNLTVNGQISLTGGALVCTGFSVTCYAFVGSGTRVLTSPSRLNISTNNGAFSNPWNNNTTGLTINNTLPVYITANLTSLSTITITNGNTAGVSDSVDFYFTTGTYVLVLAAATSIFGNVDFTGFSGSISASLGFATNMYKNLTLSSTMTWSGSTAITFPSGGTSTLTTNNNLNLAVSFVFSGGSTINLGSAITIGSGNTLTFTLCNFYTNDYNVTTGLVSAANATGNNIYMGASIWTLTGSGTVWNIAGFSLINISQDTSTIVLFDNGTITRTFAGAGANYYNLIFAGTGNSTTSFTGSYLSSGNHFKYFGSSKTDSFSIWFTAGSSNITSIETWAITGSATGIVNINSISVAVHYLSCPNIVVNSNYLQISLSNATGGPWYAGVNSTQGSGSNTGWIFSDQPNNTKFLEFF